MWHTMFVHVLWEAQAGGLTRAVMVSRILLGDPLISFVAVIAGAWRVSLSKHRRSDEKKPSQKAGMVWLRVRSNSCLLAPPLVLSLAGRDISSCLQCPHFDRILALPLYLSETWFFLLDRWFDILIQREEVGRIIPVLEGHQPFVVDSIGGSDPLFALVTQEVDIDPRASKRL